MEDATTMRTQRCTRVPDRTDLATEAMISDGRGRPSTRDPLGVLRRDLLRQDPPWFYADPIQVFMTLVRVSLTKLQ